MCLFSSCFRVDRPSVVYSLLRWYPKLAKDKGGADNCFGVGLTHQRFHELASQRRVGWGWAQMSLFSLKPRGAVP